MYIMCATANEDSWYYYYINSGYPTVNVCTGVARITFLLMMLTRLVVVVACLGSSLGSRLTRVDAVVTDGLGISLGRLD